MKTFAWNPRAAALLQLMQVTLPDFLEQAILLKSRILCAFDLVLFDELQTKPNFFSLAVDLNSKY